MAKKEKASGASVQTLLGIKAFTDYGLQTNKGELLFFLVTPSNISVLSASAVEVKVRQLMLTLSSIPDLEIVCMDSSECFDENKAYLLRRREEEYNPRIKKLLGKDLAFLSEIQLEMATARQFMFVARCRNMNPMQVFNYANTVQKTISEQGFDAHRLQKGEIKRLLALYFDVSLRGECMPDVDGAQFFAGKKKEEEADE
ncbi:MAG: hypothetical protein E7364_01135 [Clostridiales bacterium]|nr:hypothetical protein [Clostridiales bacterium]